MEGSNKRCEFYREVYDTMYKHGYRKDPQKTNSKIVVRYILKRLNSVRSILDVGCSKGWAMQRLKLRIKHVEGLEIAQEAVGYCRKKGLKCTQGSVTDMPFADGQFDLVMCVDTLEHIRKEDVPMAISECLRVSNAFFVFKAPNKNSKSSKEWFNPVSHLINNPHLTKEPPGWWQDRVKEVLDKKSVSYKVKLLEKEGIVVVSL